MYIYYIDNFACMSETYIFLAIIEPNKIILSLVLRAVNYIYFIHSGTIVDMYVLSTISSCRGNIVFG